MILWVIRVVERAFGIFGPVEGHEERLVILNEANSALIRENNRLNSELSDALRRLAEETRVRKEYEACISFETACVGCAKLLDMLHASESQREQDAAKISEASAALTGKVTCLSVCYPCEGFWCGKCQGTGWRKQDG